MGLISQLTEKVMARTIARDLMRFHESTKSPRKTQRDLLFDQIRREQDTAFGRDHHFSEIRSLDDFRRHIPITTYDYSEPYIERVKQGEINALFNCRKVLMFALTSGTSSARKFIPVTDRFLDDYRRMWKVWGLRLFAQYQDLFRRAKMTLVGDSDEFRTSSNIPCGSISGLSAQMHHPLVRNSYCLPASSMKIKDSKSRFYLAWRLGLLRDVGMWVSPNPSTHVNMARFGDERRAELIRDIHDGTINPQYEIPDAVIDSVRKQLSPHPDRASELDKIVSAKGRLLPSDVWPNLELIACWMGGTLGSYLRFFPEYFGKAAIRDIGLIASEGRMTVPKDDNTSAGILEISSIFFEFVPVNEIDSSSPTTLEAHELEEGQQYYILLTTSCGLYRYNICDVVECVGWHEQTPMLAFLNKGTHISNITGEKISEHQVAQATLAALESLDMRLDCWSLAPCWDDQLPYYGLFVEAREFESTEQAQHLADVLDQQLQRANYEYESKRSSNRLGPIHVELLADNAWKKWDAQKLASAGGVEDQFKHPCLITDAEFQSQVRVLDASN